MPYLYQIVGVIGWIWLAIFIPLFIVALLIKWSRNRRSAVRGFEVTFKDEKQS